MHNDLWPKLTYSHDLVPSCLQLNGPCKREKNTAKLAGMTLLAAHLKIS